MTDGVQVQHIHICTLIGPAWIRFEPKLQLCGSRVPSPWESLSLLYHTNAYTFPPFIVTQLALLREKPGYLGSGIALEVFLLASLKHGLHRNKDLRHSPR